jgi:hypothetical protein
VNTVREVQNCHVKKTGFALEVVEDENKKLSNTRRALRHNEAWKEGIFRSRRVRDMEGGSGDMEGGTVEMKESVKVRVSHLNVF